MKLKSFDARSWAYLCLDPSEWNPTAGVWDKCQRRRNRNVLLGTIRGGEGVLFSDLDLFSSTHEATTLELRDMLPRLAAGLCNGHEIVHRRRAHAGQIPVPPQHDRAPAQRACDAPRDHCLSNDVQTVCVRELRAHRRVGSRRAVSIVKWYADCTVLLVEDDDFVSTVSPNVGEIVCSVAELRLREFAPPPSVTYDFPPLRVQERAKKGIVHGTQ